MTLFFPYPPSPLALDKITYAERVGILPSNTALQNAAAIEQAQADMVGQFGGGKIVFGPGTFNFGACPSGEMLENVGVPYPATTCAIIAKPGISIVGAGQNGGTCLACDPTLTLLGMLSTSGQTFTDFEATANWVSGSAGSQQGSGIFNYVQSDSGLANLLAPGTFDTTVEGWTAVGDCTIASVGGVMRLTYNGTVAAAPSVQKTVSTVQGVNYRLAVRVYLDTMPADVVQVQLSSSGSVFYSQLLYDPGSFSYASVINFVAPGTSVTISFDASGTQSLYEGLHFDVDNIRLCAFSVAQQAAWFRDVLIDRVYVHNFNGYGIGVQDGDISNAVMRHLHVANVGYTGIDTKQRGPSRENFGLAFSNCTIESFCLYADTSGARGPQAGIDSHGKVCLDDILVKAFGVADQQLVGLRLRTLDDPLIPYEGEDSRGSVIDGFRIISNGLGTTTGVFTGSPDTKILNGEVRFATVGVEVTGNNFGSADRSIVSNVTIISPAQYGVDVGASNVRLQNIDVYPNGVTNVAGINNHGTSLTMAFCNDFGSTTPLSASYTPSLTQSFVACSFAPTSTNVIEISQAQSPFTYVPTTGMKTVDVYKIDAGGGGGSGALQAASTAVSGGGGGGGGSWRHGTFTAAEVGSSQVITVGLGGAGGLAPTTNNTAGNPGSPGGASDFGTLLTGFPGGGGLGGQLAVASNGGGGAGPLGAGGTATLGTTGAGGFGGGTGGGAGTSSVSSTSPYSASGGAGSTAAGAASSSGYAVDGPSGGGSGAGISSANAVANGGSSGVSGVSGTGANGGAGIGPSGTSPSISNRPVNLFFGSGAAGGASSLTAAFAGGAGGTPGGGGGGGGSAQNGGTCGPGGKGGDGFVILIERFC